MPYWGARGGGDPMMGGLPRGESLSKAYGFGGGEYGEGISDAG